MAKYGYPQCFLGEKGRAFLGYLLLLIGGLSCITGLLLVVFGFMVLGVITPYTTVLQDFKTAPFMVVYVVCGIVLIIVNLVPAYHYKKASRAASRDETKGSRNLTQLWIRTLVTSAVTITITGICIGVQLHQLDRVLKEGLGGVMNEYIQGGLPKRTMDAIQMNFMCCGDLGPEDWFTVAWKSNSYLRENDLLSCCDPESAVTPCQHEDINNVAAHGSVFDTLYQDGCQVAMADYFEQALLFPSAVFISCIICIELMNIITMRFLQTSIDNLYWASPDEPQGYSPGYLIARTKY